MSDRTPDEKRDFAAGYTVGRATGPWLIVAGRWDEDRTRAACRHILNGYETKDPTVMALCPSPLRGRWDGEAIAHLFGLESGEAWPAADAQSQYEVGFQIGFWESLLDACDRYLYGY